MTGARIGRRTALALTGGFILAGAGLPVFAAGVEPGPDLLLAQSGFEEEFVSSDGGLTVEWDGQLYQVNQSLASESSIYLNDGRSHGYSFNAGYADYDWPNDPSSVDLAIEDWFSLGMDGVEIIEKWDIDDAFAFFFTSDYGDYRGMRYFEYRYDADLEYPWINAAFSCDVGPDGNDVSRTAEYLEGVALNGESFPLVATAQGLVELIESHNL